MVRIIGIRKRITFGIRFFDQIVVGILHCAFLIRIFNHRNQVTVAVIRICLRFVFNQLNIIKINCICLIFIANIRANTFRCFSAVARSVQIKRKNKLLPAGNRRIKARFFPKCCAVCICDFDIYFEFTFCISVCHSICFCPSTDNIAVIYRTGHRHFLNKIFIRLTVAGNFIRIAAAMCRIRTDTVSGRHADREPVCSVSVFKAWILEHIVRTRRFTAFNLHGIKIRCTNTIGKQHWNLCIRCVLRHSKCYGNTAPTIVDSCIGLRMNILWIHILCATAGTVHRNTDTSAIISALRRSNILWDFYIGWGRICLSRFQNRCGKGLPNAPGSISRTAFCNNRQSTCSDIMLWSTYRSCLCRTSDCCAVPICKWIEIAVLNQIIRILSNRSRTGKAVKRFNITACAVWVCSGKNTWRSSQINSANGRNARPGCAASIIKPYSCDNIVIISECAVCSAAAYFCCVILSTIKC